MRFIICLLLAVTLSSVSIAATDSLIIKGRILNLSGRLYRQAPTITFSRNNIFQPQSELSKQVGLEADGSFRTSLPLIYGQEEIYLDYSGLAFTTFLGSPGTVEITFDGDSLKTAKRLFYFSGVNATANNLYYDYLNNENLLFKNNPALGAKFYDTFWEKDISGALKATRARSDLRKAALATTLSKNVPDAAMDFWIKSLADDENLQNMFEFALNNEIPLATLMDSLGRLSKSPLTSQRVTMASRFSTYAERKADELNFQNPAKTRSLPAKLMATLILNNVSNMSPEDRDRVIQVRENGVAARGDLDFLSKMYAKNELTLNLLFDYERSVRTYSEIFEKTAVDFLRAHYLAKNFYKFNAKQVVLLNSHLQTQINTPEFRESLNELVKLEVKDSAEVNKLIAYKDIVTAPREIMQGYWFAASNDNGVSWLNGVLNKYVGKTIYLIKWNMADEKSRDLLNFIPTLRAQLPDNVEFLFLHSTFSDELDASKDLWKKYVYQHRLQGVHMMLNSNQTMDLLFKLNPMDAGTFSIIRPNGKFFAKNAPSPADGPKVIEAILQANR